MSLSRPKFEAIDIALLSPGIPINNLYVGLRVSVLNSTEAFLKKYPDYAPEKLAGVRDEESRAALRNELDRIIEEEIGLVFAKVLEHCAVFADTEEGHIQFEHFAGTV